MQLFHENIDIFFQEKLEDWLQKAKKLLQDEINNTSKNFDFCSRMWSLPFLNAIDWQLYSCINIETCIPGYLCDSAAMKMVVLHLLFS